MRFVFRVVLIFQRLCQRVKLKGYRRHRCRCIIAKAFDNENLEIFFLLINYYQLISSIIEVIVDCIERMV